MSLTAMRRCDAAALVLAAVTAMAGLTAWLLGEVDPGVRFGIIPNGPLQGFVQVTDVMPGSLAEYYGVQPGGVVVDLQRRDGTSATQRDSTFRNDESFDQTGTYMRFVDELVPEREIEFMNLVGIELDTGRPMPFWGASVDRSQLASRLEGGGVLLLIGIGLAMAAGAAVARGWVGDARRLDGTVAGVAVAVPLMALPLLYSGTPLGVTAAPSLAAVGGLPLVWALTDGGATDEWAPRVRWLAAGLAVLAIALVVRGLIGHGGVGGLRQAVLIAATVPLLPAVAVALSGERATRDRIQILAMGLVPATAAIVDVGPFPELAPLALSVAAVVAWRAIPAALSARHSRKDRALAESQPIPEERSAQPAVPIAVTRRDLLAMLVVAVTFVIGLYGCCETGAVVFGAIFGAVVAFALHRGLMGPGWQSAAIPLGCAIAVALMALTFNASGDDYLPKLALPALAALPVAHLLAWRHPHSAWRRGLFATSIVLVGIVVLLVSGSSIGGPIGGPYQILDSGNRLMIYLALGFIALIPGLGSALSEMSAEDASPIGRLDLLAMGLTPGAAMTVLPGYTPTFWLFGLWLLALVAWRRFTIAPLLGVAQRTQRQRDLAVAAVEAERARLAADIHDDALQELSALVRRLDTSGDAEGAELARSVAERLRAITSDLRLPLLDDLGAGPALEWLVGRFQPLIDGEVHLERVDPNRPPAGVELAVFRVAQEAIANAVKHGKPPITVRYRVDDAGAVSLSVDDEGPGIAPDAPETALRAGHLGVANMQQRAEQIGALLDIRRWPSGGTHVALEWRPR
ncbi:MAG TPA: ATP-binding protein [Candidatus Limnocylindria bacterium]|nr:ATP-binding protein [Candidatus Limnocylindria bacterium]